MKNYVLSTFISLALISPWALADESAVPASMDAATTSMSAEQPTAVTEEASAESKTEDNAAADKKVDVQDPREVMRERRDNHKKAMRELRDQLRDTDKQADREKIREQARQLRDDFRQEMRKMMDDMNVMHDMRPRRANPCGSQGEQHPNCRHNSRYSAGPDWGYDNPRSGRFAPPPAWGDDFNAPSPRANMRPSRFDEEQAFRDKVTNHMENIEKLLEQVVEKLNK